MDSGNCHSHWFPWRVNLLGISDGDMIKLHKGEKTVIVHDIDAIGWRKEGWEDSPPAVEKENPRRNRRQKQLQVEKE